MVEVTPNDKGASLKVGNGYAPNDGPRTIPIPFDFSANASYTLNLLLEQVSDKIEFIQTVFIDNSSGTSALTVYAHGTQQVVSCAAGKQGYFPILSTNPPKFTIACADGVGGKRWIQFLTMPMPAAIWDGSANGTPSNVSGNLGNNVDTVAPVATGNVGTDSYLYDYDPIGAVWNRVKEFAAGVAITVANAKKLLTVNSVIYGISQNGTLLNSACVDVYPSVDNIAPTNSLATMAMVTAFNGVGFDRMPGSLIKGMQGLAVAPSPYPNGSTPIISASGNKANAAAVATLASTASTTAYITGFEITGSGATAGLPVIVTLTGILGGTLSYIYTATVGVLLPNTPLIVEFDTPLPASAVNASIVVTCPALGIGSTNNAVVAHGYFM